jgi:hypothetical protein
MDSGENGEILVVYHIAYNIMWRRDNVCASRKEDQSMVMMMRCHQSRLRYEMKTTVAYGAAALMASV